MILGYVLNIVFHIDVTRTRGDDPLDCIKLSRRL